jgi:predicted membrane channel-forming protein YqfA (hemolysin III family)
LGLVSHDAIYFSGYDFKEVPLNLFGYIVYKIGGVFYQIKPYAIWL